jgi:predicted transcriptional regulator
MHTITLKSDNDFFMMLNEMVKALDTTKSDLIRKAVVHYRDVLAKEKLKVQLRKASLRVREESLKVSKEFEGTVDDGLKNV